jgi:tRNA pseudouridine55 synthase
VDKPAGVSSHDVVAVARRAVGEKRIGHAGTLDPFATGLLVLLLGRATRLLPHMPGEPKVYDATVRFGRETDSEDLHGNVVREAPLPSRGELLALLPMLTGAIEQVPPAYSAKRIEGERAYAIARRGETPAMKPVAIQVHRWDVLGLEGSEQVSEARIRITCGGGTYVRSLARDLGRLAGSAAHLVALRRTHSGPFDVADAVSLEAVQGGAAVVRPAIDALPGFPRQVLTGEELLRIVRGIEVTATTDGPWGALVNADSGALVALAERRAGNWQPRVVMREA